MTNEIELRLVPMSARLSCLYLERGHLEADEHSLLFTDIEHQTRIPAGMVSCIFLEPGTTITHRAAQRCGYENTLLCWIAEGATRVYSAGVQGSASGTNILKQAAIHLDNKARLAAAARIFTLMWGCAPPPVRSIEQFRGMEGARVRAKYQEMAGAAGIAWSRRSIVEPQDRANQAISHATAALYGATEASILAMGYHPSIGIVHQGDSRSFVYDIADTVKFHHIMPVALRLAASAETDLRRTVRVTMRDVFRQGALMRTICDNISFVLESPDNADSNLGR